MHTTNDLHNTYPFHKLFMRTIGAHRRRCGTAFRAIGLSKGHPKILDFLITHEGCTQKEIATYCHIEPATVTSLLTSLEKASLITRTQNTADKRIWNVFLTDLGKAKQKEVATIFEEATSTCFQHFTPEEKEIFLTLLHKMYGNLTDSSTTNPTERN